MPVSQTHVPRPHLKEVDGLRGFAVSIVLLFHLGIAVHGGAVGVDIFFTISGFVITRALVNERHDTGRISLRDFAARRIRRLLPVATLVTAATLGAAGALWFQPRFLLTALDAFAAATLVENWHLIGSSASYLHDAAPSPLQHFWSLAVEEQFYLVWPLVVLACFLPRRRRTRSLLLAAATAAVSACSIAVAVHMATTAPDIAYFYTIARLWEIMAGCLCAQLTGLATRIPHLVHVIATGLGTLLVATAPFLATPEELPWPGAAPAIGGTVLILLFGLSGRVTAAAPWRLGPLRWLGVRSYSIYLWHFPLVVLTSSVLGQAAAPDRGVVAAAIASATLLLAALTFQFVEEPIRRRRRRRSDAAHLTRARPRPDTPPVFAASAVAILCVFCLAGAQLKAPTRLSDPTFLALGLGEIRSAPTPGGNLTLSALTRELRVASAAKSWPSSIERELETAYSSDLPPALDTLTGCRYAPSTATEPEAPCSWGDDDSARRALLIGDSTAAAWTTGVAGALVPRGWRVDALAPNDPSFTQRCAASRKAMIGLADDAHADLVILSSATNLFPYLASGSHGIRAEAEWRSGTLATLRALTADDRQLIILAPPPPGAPPSSCPTRLSSPSTCAGQTDDDYRRKTIAEAEAASLGRTEGIRARFVDTRSWFCAENICPLFAGERLIRADRSHLTDSMSGALSHILRTALLSPETSPRT